MKNEFLKAMKRRYACKEFDVEKKISDEDFNFILEAGRLSPSSMGLEPWQFLVFTDPQQKLDVTEFSWGGRDRATGASHFVVVLTRKNDLRYDAEYLNNYLRNHKKLPEDTITRVTELVKEFQTEDFKLLESERALADWSSKQSYIALGNMLTAGAFIDVDSCPIEGYHKEKTEKVLAEKFGIDMEKFNLSHMIAFGYAKEPSKTEKLRRKMEDVVTFM